MITHFDSVPSVYGQVLRQTQHIVPLAVQFLKFVEIFVGLSVQSQVRILASVSNKFVDPVTKIGTIEIATNVQYPNKITSVEIHPEDSAQGTVLSVQPIIDDKIQKLCPNSVGTSCTQQFSISLLARNQCSFSGNYKIVVGYECQSRDCTLTMTNSTGVILVDIFSEVFCPKISANVHIAGELSTYSSSNFTTQKTLFRSDEHSFFIAYVSSPSRVQLIRTRVRSIIVVNANNSQQMVNVYDDSNGGGNSTISESSFAYSVQSSGGNYVEFGFKLNGTLFEDFDDSDPKIIRRKKLSVIAFVDVQFAGVIGINKRNSLDALNTKQIVISSEIDYIQDSYSNGNSLRGMVIVSLILALLCF